MFLKSWVLVNFNYFISEAVFQYILDAVHLVAEKGWKLLPLYRFEPASGLWKHRCGVKEAPMSLFDVSYQDGSMKWHHRRRETEEHELASYIEDAKKILTEAQHDLPAPVGMPDVTADFEHLRWFPLPDELRIDSPTG